jgi:hypothetical protein
MKRKACIAAFTASLCVACASSPNTVPHGHGTVLTPQSALDMISVGKSRKADVSSALGAAIVIPFDSGYEVWVYRWAGADKTPRSATELVVLFGPSGLVAKSRVRPGYAPSD